MANTLPKNALDCKVPLVTPEAFMAERGEKKPFYGPYSALLTFEKPYSHAPR